MNKAQEKEKEKQGNGHSNSHNNSNNSAVNVPTRRMLELSSHLAQCLFHDNPEIVLETARVLGKLFENVIVI